MANSKKRRKTVVFGLIGVVLAGLAAVAAFKKREVVITVQTEKAARRNLTEIVVANGKIQPVLQVKISPEVSGEIIELPVKEGQAVKKGDLVLKIKPDYYLASKRSAEASYQSAIAGKNLAAANMKKAEIEYRRNTDLFRNRLISDVEHQEFMTALEVATASFQSSE